MTEDMFQRQRNFVHRRGDLNRITSTSPGMAHFAGTGDGRRCEECGSFQPTRNGSGTCAKFKQMVGAKKGIAFSGKSTSCKYVW